MRHLVIRSKMKKGRPLMADPLISRHVPETYWFRSSRLRKMLRANTTVYIKPDKGRKGNGVLRVKKLDDSEYEISHKKTTIKCSRSEVLSEVKKLLKPNRKYIVQQGIELATYTGRPFDVRVVLQKPLKRWRLTLMCAKVAPRESSVVTNVSKGAKDVNVIRALQKADQSMNAVKVMRELIDISHQIAQTLGARFPLKIIGLDMGIDKQGKVWFIEANTWPDCAGLENIDRRLYRRYRYAKRLMRKS